MATKRDSELEKENRMLRSLVATLVKDKKRKEPLELGANNKPKRVWDPKWKREEKKCPNCGDTKVIDPEFGVRLVRGVERPQPRCRDCRKSTNYHARPRTYRDPT